MICHSTLSDNFFLFMILCAKQNTKTKTHPHIKFQPIFKRIGTKIKSCFIKAVK